MPLRRRRARGRRRSVRRRVRVRRTRRTAGGRRGNKIRWRKNGFPNAMYVTMSYVMSQSIDPDNNGSNWIVLRANSINDPEYSIGGHQPFGHDQWEKIYNRYHVIRSTCTMQVMAKTVAPSTSEVLVNGTGPSLVPENTLAYSGVMFMKTDDNATLITNSPAALMEGQQCLYKPFSSLNGWSPKITMNYNARGRQLEQIHQTSAQFGHDPADQHYFHCGVMSIGGNLTACQVLVRMKYYVKVYDRRDIEQS